MICPKCESPTEVINSRKRDGTVVKVDENTPEWAKKMLINL